MDCEKLHAVFEYRFDYNLVQFLLCYVIFLVHVVLVYNILGKAEIFIDSQACMPHLVFARKNMYRNPKTADMKRSNTF